MAPKNILISIDGGTYAILKDLLETRVIDPNTGLGYLANNGVFVPSTVITPSLTAPSHIAIATGSTAAENNINANSFHLVKSPFNTNISGFGAPIGGYDTSLHGDDHEDFATTAEPLWVRLREAGKTVVAATFPGADGINVILPGVTPPTIIQSKEVRTVDYTIPFGAFGGIGARGYSLNAANFSLDATQATTDLAALGITSFSAIRVAQLETIPATGSGSLTGGSTTPYNLQLAAIDSTNDSVINYDQLIVLDANRGVERATSLPSTGSAFLDANQTIRPFFFEGSTNRIGAAFILSYLAPDLSAVRLLRTSANFIPRPAESPGVIADVEDANNNVGFWQPQPDFRIAQRVAPGLETFSDLELEAAYGDLDDTFVTYQTDLLLRAIAQNPNADLVLSYIEQPDGSEHQFLLKDPRQPTDPSNPNSIGAGQDVAKVARYNSYIESVYQLVSDAIQRVIDTVGVDSNGHPNSNIMVTSDHGFYPFHTAVNINNILTNAGFDPNKVRAVSSGPAVNIYINVKGREPNGTVDPSEYSALQQQIIETLRSALDLNPTYAPEGALPLFDRLFQRPVSSNPTVEEIINASNEFIGQDTGDVFALLSPGYNFDGFQANIRRQGDAAPASGQSLVLSVPTFYGAHGYDPNYFDLQGVLLASGPDFSSNTVPGLQRVRSIDIAPTLLDLLDVEPAPTVQGQSIFSLDPTKTFLGGDGDYEVTLGAGDNWVRTGSGTNTIYVGSGNDVINTGDGNKTIFADGGNNWIATGAGDDVVNAGDGNDYINVGNGASTIYAGKGHNEIRSGSGDDLIFGEDDADVIYAGNGSNRIFANSGNNTIVSGAGNDYIRSGLGFDIVYAGAGNDDIGVGDGNNYIDAGSGNDIVFVGIGDDTVLGGAGDDELYAGAGNNVIDAGTGNDKVVVMGDGVNLFTLNLGVGAVTIFNFDSNDKFRLGTGLALTDIILTHSGNDTFVRKGDDLLATLTWTQVNSLPI